MDAVLPVPWTDPGVTVSGPVVTVSVRDYGARGDGASDDRAAFQAALDAGAGGVVLVPAGRYLLGRGAGYWCVRVPAGTTLRGAPGAVLAQAVVGGSVRLLEIEAARVTITGLELDGQRGLQVPDEHRSGIFALGATNLTITGVTVHGFTGDGVTIHSGSDDVAITGLSSYGNGRSGIAFTGCSSRALVGGSTFRGNGAQQFDTEPTFPCHVDDVTLSGDTFDGAGASADYVLTIAGGGGSPSARSTRWTVTGCTMLGPVEVAGATWVTLSDSRIAAATGTKPALTIYRDADQIRVLRSDLSAGEAPAVIEIVGTDPLAIPDHVTLADDVVTSRSVTGMGVHAFSARTVSILRDRITGMGAASPYAYGVYARSIVPGAGLAIVVDGCTIADWGSTGLVVADTGGGVASVEASGNTFTSASGAERYGMLLPPGAVTSGNVAVPMVADLTAPAPIP